ncbi:MAG TPA: aspartate dehydrogenase [Chloroflexota bacterium]|nr:aspartate dehydrogenase [Chloroflexota bacterium]
MRVGIIGLGAIGRGVSRLLDEDDGIDVVGALVANPAKVRGEGSPAVCTDLNELLARHPEVIVELAGHAALAEHGPGVLRAGVDLLMVSVGALANPAVEFALGEAAASGGGRMIVASGAIGGLDALAAAAVGGLERVTHTTRKPAGTLMSAAEAEQLEAPKELFRGTAREGALLFPESINVAAAVSLAGIGFDRTEVRVFADPHVQRNMHEVVACGAFGELRFQIENVPSEDNPKTGRLVAMSVVHALRRRHACLIVG